MALVNAGYFTNAPATFRGIRYWPLYSPQRYATSYSEDAQEITIPIAVEWENAGDFTREALGYTTWTLGNTYFERAIPLLCPYTDHLYLSNLTKMEMGIAANGGSVEASPLLGNWPNLPDGWIAYLAKFTSRAYDVVDQNDFAGAPYGLNELTRYVIREDIARAKERRQPSFGFEYDVSTPNPTSVPEVGFIPFYDYEFTYTWMRVPWCAVPRAAMQDTFLKVNQSTFDDQYEAGSVLFKGIASKLRPYRGTRGEKLVDIPYVFGYQPADGQGNGWNKIPLRNGLWQQIRVSGTSAAPQYPYIAAPFTKLFQPDPPVTIFGSPPPDTYEANGTIDFRARVNTCQLTAPYSYSWTNTTGDSGDTAYLDVSSPGNVTVQVDVTDANGLAFSATCGPYVLV